MYHSFHISPLKLLVLSVLVASMVSCANALPDNKGKMGTNDAVVIGGQTYPDCFKFNGNPLSRIHGAADPDVQIYDDTLYVYTSQDRNLDPAKHSHHYDAMDGYHLFSTTNLIDWTDHGEIFHSSKVSWGWRLGGKLWAPGSARKNGKYYLYYPIADRENQWRVGVAISDRPTGPFVDSGAPLDGLAGIDPMVFIDDDGQAYIYCNPGVVAKLKSNMIELAEPVRNIDYAGSDVTQNEELKYCEGPYMHKYKGKYYFSYSNWHNNAHQGFYAIGDSPYGPFEWKGGFAPRPQGAQDHHSVVEFNDAWYYFYHIAIDEYPKYKEAQGRIVCFDKLHYNSDGSMQQVIHTINID